MNILAILLIPAVFAVLCALVRTGRNLGEQDGGTQWRDAVFLAATAALLGGLSGLALSLLGVGSGFAAGALLGEIGCALGLLADYILFRKRAKTRRYAYEEVTLTPETRQLCITLMVGDTLTVIADRDGWTGVYFDEMSLLAASDFLKARRRMTRNGTRITKKFVATNPGGPTKIVAVFYNYNKKPWSEVMPILEVTVVGK
jgi:hypothetical protein